MSCSIDGGGANAVETPLLDRDAIGNICRILECDPGEVRDARLLSGGLTNSSILFSCDSGQYVYRTPGVGTEKIVSRERESRVQAIAKRIGIDDTFVFEDPEQGWKISRYLPDCVEFDYHNPSHVDRGMSLIRALHRSGEKLAWDFDLHEQACGIVGLLDAVRTASFDDFDELAAMADSLAYAVKADGVAPCLCHNDYYAPNILLSESGTALIDWEYSAMSDYASDLGTFICSSDYDMEGADSAIEAYFQRTPTAAELRHCIAYTALSAYYWFVWALYKDMTGDPVGEWTDLWHDAALRYGHRALRLYGLEER